MIYEIYKNKISRVASVLSKIVKLMPLIVTLLALAVSLAAGYMIMKGMVYDMVNPSQLTYGEEAVYEAKAFFGDFGYEHRAEGTDTWIEGTPVKAGRYTVRAVSVNAFGKPRYSDPFEVTVLPRALEVSVNEREAEYGAMLSVSGATVAGDRLVCDAYDFLRTSVLSPTEPTALYNVTPSLGKIRVLNARGEDVTASYVLRAQTASVVISKLSLVIEVPDASKTYDGAPLSSDVWETVSGSLCEGDRMEVSFTASATDVGEVENMPTFRFFNAEGEDVTEYYCVQCEGGTLSVTKRPVTVTTGNMQTVYDGTPVSSDVFTVGGEGPIPGHTVKPKPGFQAPAFTNVNAEGYANEREFYIEDAAGKDCTANYEITVVAGKIVIMPRPLYVTTESESWEYDGQMHSASGYTAEGLLPGHTLDLYEPYDVVNVGKYENKLLFAIENEVGEDVSDNYYTVGIFGTLEITPRTLLIRTHSLEVVYDGEAHSARDFTAQGLLADHGVQILKDTYGTDAGVYSNVMEFKILDVMGIDVTFNYLLTIELGTLTITPRTLHVTTHSDTALVYNGEEQSFLSYNANGLVSGHDISVRSAAKIRTVAEGEIDNVIEISVVDQEGANVSANYAIEYSYGRLKIVPRPITVTTASDSWEYNGRPHKLSQAEADDLAKGDRLTVSDSVSITNVGKIENKLLAFDIVDASGVSMLENYEITWVYGELEVYTRVLCIKPKDNKKVYDGTPLRAVTWDYAENKGRGILNGHTLTAEYRGEQTDAGNAPSYIIEGSARIVDENGVDVTANYEIWYSAEPGSLIVTPRTIWIKPQDELKVYDGTPLEPRTWIYSHGADADEQYELVGNHKLTVLRYEGSQTEVGTSASTIAVNPNGTPGKPGYYRVDIRDGSRNVTSNYLVQVRNGSLTVVEKIEEPPQIDPPIDPPDNPPVDPDLPKPPDSPDNPGGSGGSDNPGGSGGSGNPTGGILRDDDCSDIRDNRTPTDPESDQDGTGAGEPYVFGEVMTEAGGVIYLRRRSFGDYEGGIWNPGPAYNTLLPGGYNYNYLTSAALSAYGLSTLAAEFKNMQASVLPYYLGLGDDGYARPDNDVSNVKLPKSYAVQYYRPVSQMNLTQLAGRLGEFEPYEKIYAQEVYRNYLAIDAETKNAMLDIVAEQGFDLGDPNLIAKISDYIRNAAVYNKDYDREMDQASNIVIAFLKEYKEGVCRHYATAAVLMYRALGIPARYVEGFMVDTRAGEYVPITGETAHAWAEVYIDGLGWIMVDATGSESTDPDDPNEDGTDGGFNGSEQGGMIRVEPNYVGKIWDGEALLPDPTDVKGNALLAELLAAGYTFKAVMTGSQTDVGQSESAIESFRLFNPDGYDVTDFYTIKMGTGLIKVFPSDRSLAQVYLHELQKTYDGKPLLFTEGDYEIVKLGDGAKLTLTFKDGLTEVGERSLSNLNADIDSYISYRVTKDGKDVTAQYLVEFVESKECGITYRPLRVERRAVELTAGSAVKYDDGKELYCNDYYISLGSLADGDRIEVFIQSVLEPLYTGEQGRYTDNVIDSWVILNAEGRDVTEQYSVSTHTGTLEIIRRTVNP